MEKIHLQCGYVLCLFQYSCIIANYTKNNLEWLVRRNTLSEVLPYSAGLDSQSPPKYFFAEVPMTFMKDKKSLFFTNIKTFICTSDLFLFLRM